MIRAATQADIPAIRSLMQSTPGFWPASWRDDVVERAIRAADGLAFVWEEGGRVVGFVCAHDVGFRGYLSALVVCVGTQIVRRVEQELTDRGCTVLYSVSDVWRDVEGFYRARGWTSPDVVLLRKTL